MIMMSRAEVLRKCLIVFDALRRVSSKGNAGLEALPGEEESFKADQQICFVLREMLQEMEAGPVTNRTQEQKPYTLEGILKGNPLMTEETIEAARRMDEARKRMYGPLEQKVGELEDYDKVTRIADWQREIMERGVPEDLRLT